MKKSLLGAVAAAAVVVGAIAAPASAAAAWPGYGHGQSAHKHGPTSIAYVEMNDNDIANAGRYTLANGEPAFDVAVIFAANIDAENGRAKLTFNQQVQATLDAAPQKIRPMQKRGTKVTLSVLGNHSGLGIANFQSRADAAAFASQISRAVAKYRLDGVDLDDEWAEYGKNGTPQANDRSIGWLIDALHAQMPGKIVSFYNIGPASDSLAKASPCTGSKLTYAWNPYYDSYDAPAIPGMSQQKLSPAAVDLSSTPIDHAVALAKRTIAEKYGVFMTYNLKNGDQSGYVSTLMTALYGQSATYR